MAQEYESTNADRLDFFFLNLVGHVVSVHTTDGGVTEGLFVSRSDDDSNAEPMILLSKARNRQSKVGGPSQKTVVTDMLKIQLSDVIFLEANAVRVEAAAAGRVEPFRQTNLSEMNWAEMPLEEEGALDSLEEEEKGWVPGKWDQFATNAQKFGVKSTYTEETYTTRLDKSKFSKEAMEYAERVSREIEKTGTRGVQHRIERGEEIDVDEGTLYSDVQRQQQAADPKKSVATAGASTGAKAGVYVAPSKKNAQGPESGASAPKPPSAATGKSSPTPEAVPNATAASASAPASIETTQNPASPSASGASLRVDARPFVPGQSFAAAAPVAVVVPRSGPVVIDDLGFLAHVARRMEQTNTALQWAQDWQGDEEQEEPVSQQQWGPGYQQGPAGFSGPSMQHQPSSMHAHQLHHQQHHQHHHHSHHMQHGGNVGSNFPPQQNFSHGGGGYGVQQHQQPIPQPGFGRNQQQQHVQSPTMTGPPPNVRIPRPVPQQAPPVTQPQQPVAATGPATPVTANQLSAAIPQQQIGVGAGATPSAPSAAPVSQVNVVDEPRRLMRGAARPTAPLRHEDPQATAPAGPAASNPPGSSVAASKKRGGK